MYSITTDIFAYDDFRAFLKDTVAELREQKDLFSYRKFSMAAGFSSPNYLILLIKGERNLSESGAQKIAQVFSLDKHRHQFFLNLVQYNQAKSLSERSNIAQTLLKIKSKSQLHFIEDAQFEYFTSWIHVAIRELLLIDQELDIDSISVRLRPRVKTEDIQKSLNLLHKLNLIRKTEKGWQSTATSLSTGDRFVASSVVQFHKEMMTLAQESLDRFSRQDRDITASTVGLSKESFEIIRQKIQDLRLEILAIAENDCKKNNVYQINFQCFPLTSTEGERK